VTDAATSPLPSTSEAPPAAAAEKRGFAFTDPGCRTDVRVGSLLILAALFLWLWFGPQTSARIFLVGAPFLAWGIPLQAIQAWRQGRPGYPWKLGLAMTAMGIFTWMDLRFRELPGGPVEVQIIAPLLTAAGAWILVWWPISRLKHVAEDA
jgi:hypothetical protein